MSDKKFFIILFTIIGIGLAVTIAHAIYIYNVFGYSSIIQFIAREFWPWEGKLFI